MSSKYQCWQLPVCVPNTDIILPAAQYIFIYTKLPAKHQWFEVLEALQYVQTQIPFFSMSKLCSFSLVLYHRSYPPPTWDWVVNWITGLSSSFSWIGAICTHSCHDFMVDAVVLPLLDFTLHHMTLFDQCNVGICDTKA